MEKKSPRKIFKLKKAETRSKPLTAKKNPSAKAKVPKKAALHPVKSALPEKSAKKKIEVPKAVKLTVAKAKAPEAKPVQKSARITKAIRALPKLSETVETTRSAPLRVTLSTAGKSQSSRSVSKDSRTVTSAKSASKNGLKKKAAASATAVEIETPQPLKPVMKELPHSYNQTRMVLMVRDPFWAYTYWDFSGETWGWIAAFFERDSRALPKLRIHNLDQKQSYDMDISLEAKNWYLELGMPNTSFEVELGMVDSRGKFHRIIKSNRIRTPRNTPSDKVDHKWESSELEFAEIYRLSGGGQNVVHGSEAFSSLRRRSS